MSESNTLGANRSSLVNWQQAFATYTHPSVITLLFLGFSAGLPILLIFGTLSFWLSRAGVDISVITYFSWAALGYSFKFVWAPLIDRLPFPYLHSVLGRRRSWLLVTQLLVLFAIAQMGLTEPVPASLERMAYFAVLLGFAGASQDIVIDAYRIEIAKPEYQAAMSAMYVAGYRIGMLIAGAGAFYLVDGFSLGAQAMQLLLAYAGNDVYSLMTYSSTQNIYIYEAWRLTYLILAGFMLMGVMTTLIMAEPETRKRFSLGDNSAGDYIRFLLFFALTTVSFIFAFIYTGPTYTFAFLEYLGFDLNVGAGEAPLILKFIAQVFRIIVSVAIAIGIAKLLSLLELVKRSMLEETYINPVTDFIHRYKKTFIIILLLIGFYRISDIVLGVTAILFYEKLGFSGVEIANISKTFGLFMIIAGGFLGGVLTVRFGVLKILLLGGVLAAATNILFMWFAYVGNDTTIFIIVIAADNLSAGLAGTAFIAYLSSLTNISFTAVQYAIFTSVMTLIPKLIGGYSGSIVENIGYEYFFLFTTILGVPVVLLILYLIKQDRLERY